MSLSPRGIARAAAGVAAIAVSGASCSTIDIVNGYNSGAHGTPGDPAESVDQTGARVVAATIRDQMTGSYFAQGAGGDPTLGAWTTYAKGAFAAHVVAAAKARRADIGSGSRVDVDTVSRRASYMPTYADAPWNQLSPAFDACGGGGLTPKARAYADAVRFRVAYVQAVATVSDWYAHGLMSDRALERGANLGFDETHAYLSNRKWVREATHPTPGLVVSGGASNGMFSAGAVWVALQMIHGCIRSQQCKAPDPRFRLVSGTSAGAMIGTAVDLFNTEVEPDVQRKAAGAAGGPPARSLDLLAGWFTCLPANQLYCVEDESTVSLFTSRVGLANFDGIRYLLSKSVTPAMQGNVSELILNTVDFQTGELLALSDQNPFETAGRCDVVQQALASIPLPLIANPQRELRIQGELRRGFYLDGGVRSTLPLFPVVQRGAERILVVSSSPLIQGGAAVPGSAIELLDRYTGISSGATSEEGVALAKARADLQRTRERDACLAAFGGGHAPAILAATGTVAGAVGGRMGAAAATVAGDGPLHAPTWWPDFCDADFESVCAPASARPTDFREPPRFEEIYRDEQRIDAASGYNFDPRESLLLFLAGADAARQRCARLAKFFGMDDDPATIKAWCNAPLPARDLCKDPAFQHVFATSNDRDARRCNDDDAAKSRAAGCP